MEKAHQGSIRSLGGSTNMLDDAEGNRFLLWRDHFGHVVLTRVRIILW